jgi:hypothetical protein
VSTIQVSLTHELQIARIQQKQTKGVMKKSRGLEKFWRRHKCRCALHALFNMQQQSERMKNKRAVRDGKKKPA